MRSFLNVTSHRFVSLLVALAFAGCTQPEPATPSPSSPEPGVIPEPGDDKADTLTGNGDLFITRNENADALFGFHPLFDRTTGTQCVENQRDGDILIRAGSTAGSFEAAYVESREQLATSLGIDLGLRIRYGVARANASMNMLQQFSSSSRTVHFLLKATEEYGVQNRSPVKLTSDAAAQLSNDPGAFVQGCGLNYINGVRYGAHLYVLLTFTAQDAATATEVAASLGGRVSTGFTSVSGDLKTRFSSIAQRSGVSTTVRVISRGFNTQTLEASLTQLNTSPLSDQTFSTIETIRRAMQTSVGRDMCRDAGEGMCEGGAAPGYLRNAQRFAQPVGLQLGFYESVGGVPSGAGAAFEGMRENVREVERYVRAFSEMKERMETAHDNEIDVFLRASDADKARFQVAPPGEPKTTIQELTTLANVWRQNFYPADRGSPVGWDVEIANNLINACWNRAATNSGETCGSPEGPEFDGLLEKLEEYRDNARILEMVVAGGSPQPGSNAHNFCNTLDGAKWRLPTASEAVLLYPYISGGSIPFPAGSPNEIIYAQEAADCPMMGEDPSFTVSSVVVQPSGQWSYYCSQVNRQIATVCVAASGPVPQLPDP